MASTKISNILASYISLFLVAALLVALRIYVKIRIVRNWGPEDYACIFALVRCFLITLRAFISEYGSVANQVDRYAQSTRHTSSVAVRASQVPANVQ